MTDSGNWYQTFSIDSLPWDSGTDSGTTFKSDNLLTDPQVMPFPLTVNTVPDTEVFLDSSGTTVMPVASWACSVVRSKLKDTSEVEVTYGAMGTSETEDDTTNGSASFAPLTFFAVATTVASFY